MSAIWPYLPSNELLIKAEFAIALMSVQNPWALYTLDKTIVRFRIIFLSFEIEPNKWTGQLFPLKVLCKIAIKKSHLFRNGQR